MCDLERDRGPRRRVRGDAAIGGRVDQICRSCDGVRHPAKGGGGSDTVRLRWTRRPVAVVALVVVAFWT